MKIKKKEQAIEYHASYLYPNILNCILDRGGDSTNSHINSYKILSAYEIATEEAWSAPRWATRVANVDSNLARRQQSIAFQRNMVLSVATANILYVKVSYDLCI